MMKIRNGRSLTQELWIDGHGKITAVLFSRKDLECRHDRVFNRPGQHRAPDGDHVKPPLAFQRQANLLAGALDVGQIQRAVGLARSAHAYQRQVTVVHGVGSISRRPYSPVLDRPSYEVLDPWFDDGRTAVIDDLDFQ